MQHNTVLDCTNKIKIQTEVQSTENIQTEDNIRNDVSDDFRDTIPYVYKNHQKVGTAGSGDVRLW